MTPIAHKANAVLGIRPVLDYRIAAICDSIICTTEVVLPRRTHTHKEAWIRCVRTASSTDTAVPTTAWGRLTERAQSLGVWPGLAPHCTYLMECVRQRNVIDVAAVPVRRELRVDVEENWHVKSFSATEPLLFEAEALDFVEVEGCLVRSHIVNGVPGDGLIAKTWRKRRDERF